MKSIFRILGLAQLLGGIAVAAYYYFFFDTSVPVFGEAVFGVNRINNIGLMAQRQNGIVFSFGAAALGCLLTYVGRDPTIGYNTSKQKCPHCAETIQKEALMCRYCGKDLS